MAEGFIPYRDAEALQWMQAFSAGISASPATFQLTAADAAAIDSAVDQFAAALSLATTPPTRTPSNISLKDQTRNSAEQICRQYAIGIKYSAGISDQSKIDIGVRPVNTDHDPIPVPPTSPLLSIIGCTPGSQTLRYSDSTTPDSRGKPFGATELRVARHTCLLAHHTCKPETPRL